MFSDTQAKDVGGGGGASLTLPFLSSPQHICDKVLSFLILK